MSKIQKVVLIAGVKIKLARGEKLEDILKTYVKLSDEEKEEVRGCLKN